MEKRCRYCRGDKLVEFLDLGFHPPSDNFISRLDEPEIFYPLNVCICVTCKGIQLGYVVPPERMFNADYPYESSMTATGRKHFTEMAQHVCSTLSIEKGSLVVDVGSNDGLLLSGFKEQGMTVLGVEPSTNIAKIANSRGIDTIPQFWSEKLCIDIARKHGKAKVITCTNVFAHIADLYDFMNGVARLLDEHGVLVIESPYAVRLFENLEFDTIYHEHIGYISVRPLIPFFERFGMEMFNIEEYPIHGGSVRIYVARNGARKVSSVVAEMAKDESCIYDIMFLRSFAEKVANLRKELVLLLLDLKKKGKRIAGVSAPAKGNTLLNYCKIDTFFLDYLTEKSKLKIGKFSPGMHIPVCGDAKLLEDKPDYALILAWNFAPEIMKNLDAYKKQGGQFIIPIPRPEVV